MNRVIFRSLITALVLFVLFCVPSIASADGITWTLSGVTFDDGGTASGSFVYDALTNTYSSIDITTTLGSTFPGATYTGLVDSSFTLPSDTGLILGAPDFLGPIFQLIFQDHLTNSGGTVFLMNGAFDPIAVELTGSGEFTCEPPDCSSFTPDPPRLVTGGTVSGVPATAVPEPSALSLLSMGLVALLVGAAIGKVTHA
jgi:hypothetical protein